VKTTVTAGSAFVLVGFVVWPAATGAATLIDAGDVGGQDWTADGSPYVIRGNPGDLFVPYGAELRIEAGTEVQFGPDSGGIQVEGSLTVSGNPASPVILRAESGGTEVVWSGIILARTGRLMIGGAVIRNAQNGVTLVQTQVGGHVLVGTTFENCATGMNVVGGTYAFDSIVFRQNGTGVLVANDNGLPDLTLTNALVQGNGVGVMASNGARLTVINGTLDHNQTAAVDDSSTGNAWITLDNAIVSNNATALQVTEIQQAFVTVSSSTFWANGVTLAHLSDGGTSSVAGPDALSTLGYANATADPMYASATDPHLTAGSPCIDSGNAINAPNHDFDGDARPLGAGIDRGAFEFVPGGAGGAGGAVGGGGGTTGTAGGPGAGGAVVTPGEKTGGANSGCACGVGDTGDGRPGFAALALAVLLLFRRRRLPERYSISSRSFALTTTWLPPGSSTSWKNE
jgi:MYXO-CTERM domain-containing protein